MSNNENKLQIYLISREDTNVSTDVNDSYVIVDFNERRAISQAASKARDEGGDIWLKTGRATYLGKYSGPLDYAHVVSTEGRDG